LRSGQSDCPLKALAGDASPIYATKDGGLW
jgi:hypothetical protein